MYPIQAISPIFSSGVGAFLSGPFSDLRRGEGAGGQRHDVSEREAEQEQHDDEDGLFEAIAQHRGHDDGGGEAAVEGGAKAQLVDEDGHAKACGHAAVDHRHEGTAAPAEIEAEHAEHHLEEGQRQERTCRQFRP